MAVDSTATLARMLQDPDLNLKKDRSYEESLSRIASAFQASKEKRDADYGQELLNQNRFNSRLDIPTLNAFEDSSIYDNKAIDELEATFTRIKNEDIRRFPGQSVDFMDIFDTKIEKLKEYRSLNNQYNHYASKIPEAEKFLLDMTNDLTSVTWEDLTPTRKREIKDKLFDGTQQIAEFSKFLDNNQDYFKNNRSFNTNKDNVDIGIIGGYNQLLTQIETLDPEGTVISKDEQAMMIKSIRDKRPDEIVLRNETIARIADKRVVNYQNDFDTAYATHTTNTAIMNSPDFKREAARIDGLFAEKLEGLNDKLARNNITQEQHTNQLSEYADNPINWTTILPDGKQINVMEMRTNQASLETIMNIADANFEKETGSKYSAWMGKRTPWREPIDEEISTEEQIEKPIIPEISQYIENKERLLASGVKESVKERGLGYIKELESLDVRQPEIDNEIKQLEQEQIQKKSRLKEVTDELTTMQDVYGEPRRLDPTGRKFIFKENFPEDQRENYTSLIKELHTLKNELSKSPGTKEERRRHGHYRLKSRSYYARIKKLKNELSQIKNKRTNIKSKLSSVNKLVR